METLINFHPSHTIRSSITSSISGFLLHVSITVIIAATVLDRVMVKSEKTDHTILQ